MAKGDTVPAVEADAFVDDILIAPHVTVMDEVQFVLKEGSQFVGRVTESVMMVLPG